MNEVIEDPTSGKLKKKRRNKRPKSKRKRRVKRKLNAKRNVKRRPRAKGRLPPPVINIDNTTYWPIGNEEEIPHRPRARKAAKPLPVPKPEPTQQHVAKPITEPIRIKKPRKQRVVYQDESSSEEEVVVVKRRPKQRKIKVKKKVRVVYQDESSSSESDDPNDSDYAPETYTVNSLDMYNFI